MGKVMGRIRQSFQAIPAKEIQAHYATQLEVNLAVIKAQREVAALLVPAQQAFVALCEKYGVKMDEYDFDLKAGTMTKKPIVKIDEAIEGAK